MKAETCEIFFFNFCSVPLDKSTCSEARNHNQLIWISIPEKGINILYHLLLLQRDFANRVFQALFESLSSLHGISTVSDVNGVKVVLFVVLGSQGCSVLLNNL